MLTIRRGPLAFTAAALLLASTTTALADNLEDDVLEDSGQQIVLVAGDGGSATAQIRVHATGGDAEDAPGSNCNVDPGELLVLGINTPSGVTATPSTLVFGGSGSVGCETWQTVTFTASTGALSGDVTVTVLQDTTGPSGYRNHVRIPVRVDQPVVAADEVGPAVTVPADIALEATGPAGAVATWTSTAIDDRDGPLVPVCSPSSGTMFPLGTTLVTCTASDLAGNLGWDTFSVTVVDTTPPSITGLPANMQVVASSSSGAVVSWTAPVVTDVADPAPSLSYTSPPGSLFPLGSTVVTATATDASGNEASASFTVTVQYASTGVLQPVNADGSSAFKVGSTVPIKVKLTGDSAGVADALISIKVAKVGSVVGEDLVYESAVSTSSHTGVYLRYDARSDQYIFNLSTKGSPMGSTGQYQASLDFGGGKVLDVTFSLVR